ncbi:hypothetical protein N656DRAFT_7975 [Canariomyces notabilis]|uniref:Uncharacterized protein n=1 Tax=Canariomyces notabilis TaxID=2074819 RepID=A0AAN6YX68_9PEZI|nr:hypothetical protein N656DRAFT_7975 [Canariomyces arenarius]
MESSYGPESGSASQEHLITLHFPKRLSSHANKLGSPNQQSRLPTDWLIHNSTSSRHPTRPIPRNAIFFDMLETCMEYRGCVMSSPLSPSRTSMRWVTTEYEVCTCAAAAMQQNPEGKPTQHERLLIQSPAHLQQCTAGGRRAETRFSVV